MQSIEVSKGSFVMVSSIACYDYSKLTDVTTIELKGRKKTPIHIPGDFTKKINNFLARGARILYRDGTMQDRM